MRRKLYLPFLVLLAAGVGSSHEAPRNAPRPHSLLLKSVDACIQERFQHVTEADIKKGNLGVSRVAIYSRHRWHFDPKNDAERLAISNLKAEGWSTSFYVVGTRKDYVIGPVPLHPKAGSLRIDRKAIAGIGQPAIAYNSAFRGASDSIALEARPVVASQKKCLKCHRRTKLGEPVAAVVYAFRRSVP